MFWHFLRNLPVVSILCAARRVKTVKNIDAVGAADLQFHTHEKCKFNLNRPNKSMDLGTDI